jgi:hypothetical protein
MKWTMKLVVEVVPGEPIEHEVATIERSEEISPGIVGLTIHEGKLILESAQKRIVTEQVKQHCASMQLCPRCGKSFRTKGYYQSTLRSIYGNVDMRIRRLHACSCSEAQARTFSSLFTNNNPVTPELPIPHRQDGCVAAIW